MGKFYPVVVLSSVKWNLRNLNLSVTHFVLRIWICASANERRRRLSANNSLSFWSIRHSVLWKTSEDFGKRVHKLYGAPFVRAHFWQNCPFNALCWSYIICIQKLHGLLALFACLYKPFLISSSVILRQMSQWCGNPLTCGKNKSKISSVAPLTKHGQK